MQSPQTRQSVADEKNTMQTMCQMHEGHTAEAEKQALNNVIALFSWDFNRKNPGIWCESPSVLLSGGAIRPSVLLSGGAIRPSCSPVRWCDSPQLFDDEMRTCEEYEQGAEPLLASNSDCWNEIN